MAFKDPHCLNIIVLILTTIRWKLKVQTVICGMLRMFSSYSGSFITTAK